MNDMEVAYNDVKRTIASLIQNPQGSCTLIYYWCQEDQCNEVYMIPTVKISSDDHTHLRILQGSLKSHLPVLQKEEDRYTNMRFGEGEKHSLLVFHRAWAWWNCCTTNGTNTELGVPVPCVRFDGDDQDADGCPADAQHGKWVPYARGHAPYLWEVHITEFFTFGSYA